MNLKKIYLLIFVFFGLYIFSCSCTYTCNSINLVEDNYLTVATNTPFWPWEYRSGEEVIGVDIDVANEIAKNINKELKIRDVSFDALVIELAEKKCDLAIAAMSSTPERSKSVDFSEPYFKSNQAVLIKKNSGILSPKDLKNKIIGVQTGTTGDSYCDGKYQTSKYSNIIDAVEDLINGHVDAVVLDEYLAKNFQQKRGDKIETMNEFLFTEEYRIAVQKDNKELKKIINNIINKLVNEDFVNSRLLEYSQKEEQEVNEENNNSSPEFLGQIKNNLFNKGRFWLIINGLLVTFKITIFSLIIGIFLGYITAVLILSKNKNLFVKFLKFLAKSYISIIRGTPVVCQLFIIYYLVLSPFKADKVLCAIIAFGINSGAYVSEIIRSGILSVDIGQIEAGKALGLNESHIMWHIIAPQALKNSLATLCNEFMQLIKETSVAGFIGVTELTRSGEIIRSQTLSPFVPLMTTALIYFVVVHLVGLLMAFFERRLRKSDKS